MPQGEEDVDREYLQHDGGEPVEIELHREIARPDGLAAYRRREHSIEGKLDPQMVAGDGQLVDNIHVRREDRDKHGSRKQHRFGARQIDQQAAAKGMARGGITASATGCGGAFQISYAR